MDPELQKFCLLMGFAFVSVILLAMGVQLAKVYRARNWPMTTGTITQSKVRSHKRQTMDEGSRYESEPLVMYEYQVDKAPYRGTRISFAERIGGADVLPTLARYPAGKKVQVYYNPANPKQAVLERDLPPVVFVGVGILVLFFLGGAILFPLALTGTINLIAPSLPNPDRAPLVAMLGGMGLFAALMWYAIQKEAWAAKGWSVTTGKILVADVESYQAWMSSSRGSSRRTTLFRPSIVYTFEVNSQQFISDHVHLGGQVGAAVGRSAPGFVTDQAAKYPVGSEVTVYYNPQNPTESVLERGATGVIVLPIIAVALWLLAAVVGWR